MPETVREIQPEVQQTAYAHQTEQPKAIPTSNNTNTPQAEDIVSRASQVSLEAKGESQAAGEVDILSGSDFDRNKFNDMLQKLPEDQRQQLESAYKSLQKGANQKFQTAAEKLKQAESLAKQPWTIERVRQELQNPDFVQAAQTYAQQQAVQQNPKDSGLDDQEWSALSDSDRKQFHTMAQNQQALQSQLDTILTRQEDDRLKERYKNYDQTRVRQLRDDLIGGRVQATGEHLWKVLDYEPAIERAYQLGRQDRQLDLQDKQNATSVGTGGFNMTEANDVPVKEKNEGTVDFFRRLAQRNIQKAQQARSAQR